jgi:hypothetical protein
MTAKPTMQLVKDMNCANSSVSMGRDRREETHYREAAQEAHEGPGGPAQEGRDKDGGGEDNEDAATCCPYEQNAHLQLRDVRFSY